MPDPCSAPAGLTQTQKVNRRQQAALVAANRGALRMAERAHWVDLRSTGTLPPWGESKKQEHRRKLAERRDRAWEAAQRRISAHADRGHSGNTEAAAE